MKCIVTAGPTYEELDEVRRLTNFSTGALGTELANDLARHGHDVLLLRGHYSTCQVESKAQTLQIFTTTADLRRQLQELRSDKVNAVFHAAAVSDFTFGKIWRRAPGGKLLQIRARKIPTHDGTILAELKPTLKIISRLRAWFPKSQLVGWKYEVDGNRKQAVQFAERQIKGNRTDACVVNGPAYGKGFGLVTRDGLCQHLRDKTELFDALAVFIAGGALGYRPRL